MMNIDILKKFFKNKLALTITIAVIIIGFGAYSKFQVKDNKKTVTNHVQKSQGSLLNQINKDIVLGDKNAPVTLIEYASLSCPHCANFYNNVFSKIDEKYVQTGKVKMIFRDFPLNQSAMMASVIAKCHARNNNNDPKKYYKFIKVLFKTQESWAFTNEFFEKLRSIAKLDGMSADQFDTCVNDKALIDEILQDRLQAAQELGISSVPTFVLNGKLMGYANYKEFSKLIEKEL